MSVLTFEHRYWKRFTIQQHARSNGCWVPNGLGHGGEAVGVAVHDQADVFGLQFPGGMSKADVIPEDDHVSLVLIWTQDQRGLISVHAFIFAFVRVPVAPKASCTSRCLASAASTLSARGTASSLNIPSLRGAKDNTGEDVL